MAPLSRTLPLTLLIASVIFSEARRIATSQMLSVVAKNVTYVDITDKFNGEKTVKLGGITYRCCCMVGGPDGGVTCKVQDVSAPSKDNRYWGGCGRLLGEGWHSYLPKPEFGSRKHAGRCWLPEDTLPLAFKGPNVAKTVEHGSNKFEAQCESDDDHGWPRFQSKEELQSSPWASYFRDVYGELPEVYPVCVYDLWSIDKVAYEKANIPRQAVAATPGCKDCLKEGDLFEGGFKGYGIYHSTWKPLPSKTWVEVSHNALPTEIEGFWVWRTRGSGIWYNTGNTMVFPQPKNPMHTHAEAIKFLKQNCSVKISPYWPRQESDIFGACAKEKGIDSIQFEPQEGQVPLGSFGQTGLTEMLIVNMDGKFNCGVQDASKTPLREGWLAARQCECINYEVPDSCGLMPAPPPGMGFFEDPPLCKLRDVKVHFWESKPKCIPSACLPTQCGSHHNANA